MKSFIGAKVILAEPMDECSFLTEVKKQPLVEGQETRPGYHVVYANPDGEDYHSWSPKDVFEGAYREVTSGEKELINR